MWFHLLLTVMLIKLYLIYNSREYSSYLEHFNKAYFARTNIVLKVNRATNLHLEVLSRVLVL